jgi:ABC-type lipoprotein release transport system permease subunit
MNRDRRDEELRQELESHLRMAAEDRVERGQRADEAYAAAKLELGNEALIRETSREMDGWAWWERLQQDLRFAVRLMQRNPVFATVSIITLALGIGTTTAIFSVVYGVLLRPLPYPHPEKIVRIWEVTGHDHHSAVADPNFDDLRAQNKYLDGMFKLSYGLESVSYRKDAKRIATAYVSRDFLRVMGVQPFLGRFFSESEQQVNAPVVALVSYSYWQQSLGASRDLSSSTLKISNRTASVIGVLPPGFHFPEDTQIWLSAERWPKTNSRTAHNWIAIGRITDAASLQQARSELAAIAVRIRLANPTDIDMTSAYAEPLREALTSQVRPALLVLLSVAGLLLLVACANVMNLMLAQAAARSNELAVRAALGASRGRLLRQFLAESLVLCTAGGVAGLFVAYVGVPVLVRLAPRNIPRLDEVNVNWPVLLFALAVSAFVAIALGILTALRATANDPQRALAEGGKAQGTANSSERTGRIVVAGQLAITMLLLISAGLMGRSMLRVLSADPGFRTDGITVLDVAVANAAEGQHLVRVLDQLQANLRALPGVNAVGTSDALPLAMGVPSDGTFAVVNPDQFPPKAKALMARSNAMQGELSEQDMNDLVEFFTGLFRDKEHTGYADYAKAGPGYFQAMGIPLKRGRFFNESDGPDAPHVAVISESVARQMWPKEDPLGHNIEFMDGDVRLLTVVGVVGDVREASMEAPPRPTIYVDYRQRPRGRGQFGIVTRGSVPPGTVLEVARNTLRKLDPDTPVKLSTFNDVVTTSLSGRKFNLVLVGAFSASALLLAMVGIYGVLAYSVARRTREIGVRMALGASSGSVIGLVVRRSLLTAATGVLFGSLAGVLATRWISSLLYEISALDPLTFALVALLLLGVALLAACIPAIRASHIDPMVALRYE